MEADIRQSGIAMSELEYTMLIRAMTGCVSSAIPHAETRLTSRVARHTANA